MTERLQQSIIEGLNHRLYESWDDDEKRCLLAELDRARASEARLDEAERLLGRSAEMHRRGFWSSDFADQIGAFLSAMGGEPT